MNVEKMFSTIDTHLAGEAFRIVVHSSITLNEQDIKSNHDLLQRTYRSEKELLLNEPRGHRGMNGCIVIPSKVADYGLLFFNHDSRIQFKYGGLVTSITALLETGNVTGNENERYKIETVNGIYAVEAKFDNQEVSSVYFESGKCRIVKEFPEYFSVEVDGSRNYLTFALPESIPGIDFEHLSSINKWGRETTKKLAEDGILFDGIIISEILGNLANEVRSVTFEQDGSMLRSPGVDSTFALFEGLLSTTAIQYGAFTNRSIFDSALTAKLLPETNHRFSVETRGFTTGMHQFIYDQADPLKNGFLLK